MGPSTTCRTFSSSALQSIQRPRCRYMCYSATIQTAYSRVVNNLFQWTIYLKYLKAYTLHILISDIQNRKSIYLKSNHSLVSHARLTGRELFLSNHSITSFTIIAPVSSRKLYPAYPTPQIPFFITKAQSYFDERMSKRFCRSNPFLWIQFQATSQ
jgi:hypothetical protein